MLSRIDTSVVSNGGASRGLNGEYSRKRQPSGPCPAMKSEPAHVTLKDAGFLLQGERPPSLISIPTVPRERDRNSQEGWFN